MYCTSKISSGKLLCAADDEDRDEGRCPDVSGDSRGALARVETHVRDRSVRNCVRGRLGARSATPSRVATPSRSSPRSCVPTWQEVPGCGGPIRPGRGRSRGPSLRPRCDRRRRRHDPRHRIPRLLVRPRPVTSRARPSPARPRQSPSAPPGKERRRLSATGEKRPRSALTPRPHPSFVSPARTPPPSPSSTPAALSSRTR